MTYEEKYNSALAWIRAKIYPHTCGNEKKDFEEYFPELKESEDERIRKELISHFNSYKANCSSDWYGIKVNSIIAWLENQERTMHTKNSDDFIVKSEGLDEVEKYILSLVPSRSLDAIKVDAKNLRFLVEKEQKPTEWSEEDLQMLQDVISGLEATKQLTYAHEPQGKAQMQERVDWLKSIKDRAVPQHKQVWSEEDDNNLQNTILLLEYPAAVCTAENDDLRYKVIDWLKSLRPHWKPSEEQMKILRKYVMGEWRDLTIGQDRILTSLYTDLQKIF